MKGNQLAQLRRNALAAGNKAGVSAIASAELSRSMRGRVSRVGGDAPVTVTVPIRTESVLNVRNKWATIDLKKRQRDAVQLVVGRLALPDLPVRVTLWRVYAGRGKPLDGHDNLAASLKAATDQVAELYGVPDSDPRIEWIPMQGEGDEWGIRIEIRPVRPTRGATP